MAQKEKSEDDQSYEDSASGHHEYHDNTSSSFWDISVGTKVMDQVTDIAMAVVMAMLCYYGWKTFNKVSQYILWIGNYCFLLTSQHTNTFLTASATRNTGEVRQNPLISNRISTHTTCHNLSTCFLNIIRLVRISKESMQDLERWLNRLNIL